MFNPKNDSMACQEKFHGNFRGRVVSTADPYGAGRVRVRVYGVYDGVPDSSLPWAIFSDPFMGGQAGIGGFVVPDVGSDVWVFFEEGNHMLPVYFAGAPARPHGPPERSAGPHNKVLHTKAGHIIEVDDEGNRIRIHHSSGTDIHIDSGGNITLTGVGDVTHNISGNLTENVSGNVTIAAGGDVKVTGARIDLN